MCSLCIMYYTVQVLYSVTVNPLSNRPYSTYCIYIRPNGTQSLIAHATESLKEAAYPSIER